MNTVILANGEFPRNPALLRALRNAEHLICCDGAAEKLLASGIRKPDIVIGDIDSLPDNLKKESGLRVVRVSEQETNDLQKAWRFCRAQGWQGISILGGTGYREDHTLSNIALLADFAKTSPSIRMLTDYGEFQAVCGAREFQCQPGQQISIFCFDGAQEITSEGLKYPLDKMRLPKLWQGALNEALGDRFKISVDGGDMPVLVYMKY